eukprot:scaffold1291_cov412-Prasinococcus_capsulatus_cf.AAC.10
MFAVHDAVHGNHRTDFEGGRRSLEPVQPIWYREGPARTRPGACFLPALSDIVRRCQPNACGKYELVRHVK